MTGQVVVYGVLLMEDSSTVSRWSKSKLSDGYLVKVGRLLSCLVVEDW